MPDDDADEDGRVLARAGEEGLQWLSSPSSSRPFLAATPGVASIGTIVWIIVLTKEVRGSVALEVSRSV